MEVIAGYADAPARLEAAHILKGAELANVIIGQDCWVNQQITLGEGVRFTDNATIPPEVDLTQALVTDDGIDLTTDIVIDGPNLLTQINELLEMQTNEWELTQNSDTGELEVMVDGSRLVIKPKQVKQAKRHRQPEIITHDDGMVTVITAQGREIFIEIE
jgi:hypothetical protein